MSKLKAKPVNNVQCDKYILMYMECGKQFQKKEFDTEKEAEDWAKNSKNIIRYMIGHGTKVVKPF